MTVILTGHIDVPLKRLEEVKTALQEHIRLTRAEPGCLRFDVVADDTVPGRFNVFETFVDHAAFDHHQTRTQSSVWAEITQGIPRSYTISY